MHATMTQDSSRRGPRVVIVMGPAGAGKTTVGSALALALGWAFLDADDFHVAESRRLMAAGVALTDVERGPWLAALSARVEAVLAAGGSAVLACSALKRSYRRTLVPAGRESAVCFVYLEVPAAVLAERLVGREGHFAGVGLLESQLEVLEEPEGGEVAASLTVDATQSVTDLVDAIGRWLLTAAESPGPDRFSARGSP